MAIEGSDYINEAGKKGGVMSILLTAMKEATAKENSILPLTEAKSLGFRLSLLLFPPTMTFMRKS